MRRLVTVSVTARRPAPPPAPCPDPPRALLLRGISAGRVHEFTVWAGGADSTRATGADEHLAADADTCREHRWLSCSDVLYASRARPSPAALRWLTDVTAAYPGCRLAAAPLAEGGWAILDGTGRSPVLLAPRVPPDQPLLASCLHAWLVTGHEVRDLRDIHMPRGE
ncbi:hypothetical protein [Streptomyces geranii]|uniref:hypothetical protein n=1 Tax=Streptomyces geranii TaxID=2058923 RepID=UPI000D0325AC|nr:hypothetical protein [Streptomyces geranii]